MNATMRLILSYVPKINWRSNIFWAGKIPRLPFKNLKLNKLSVVPGSPLRVTCRLNYLVSKPQGNIVLKKNLLIFTFILVGCANPGDESVEALNTLEFQPGVISPAINSNPEELKSLHAANKKAITRLTTEIKAARVDHLRSVDVFDNRYGINDVFHALTKLEEFDELNNIYLKDQNKNGLSQINNALKPIAERNS